MALRCLSSSKAAAQNCRCRISLSRGSTSYSMPRRSMVARCAFDDARRRPRAPARPLRLRRLRSRAAFRRATRATPDGPCNSCEMLGVEIPAVVIEADGGVGDQRLHFGGGLVLQVIEARPPRRPPGRRCCRCSSALPPGSRRRAACARRCRRGRRCAGGRCAPPCWD